MGSVPTFEPPAATPASGKHESQKARKPGLRPLLGLLLLFYLGWCAVHSMQQAAQPPSVDRRVAGPGIPQLPAVFTVPPDQSEFARTAYKQLLQMCPRIGLVAADIVERAVDYEENADQDWRKHPPYWKGWVEVRLRTASTLASPAWGDHLHDPNFADANAFFRFGIGSDRCRAMIAFKDNGPWLCAVTSAPVGATYIPLVAGPAESAWPPPADCSRTH
jgi:hypothetical protein